MSTTAQRTTEAGRGPAWANHERPAQATGTYTVHNERRGSDGHLIRVLPRVYAVGHAAPSREADLWAAILYAGPGAMLSHGNRRALAWADRLPAVDDRSRHPSRDQVDGGVQGLRAAADGTPLPHPTARHPDPPNRPRSRRDQQYQGRRRRRSPSSTTATSSTSTPSKRSASTGAPEASAYTRPSKPTSPSSRPYQRQLRRAFLEFCERLEDPRPQLQRAPPRHPVDAHWQNTSLVVELDGADNHRTKPNSTET